MRRLGFQKLNHQRTRRIITSSSILLPHPASSSSSQETILSSQIPKPKTDFPSSFSFLRESKSSISCPVRFSSDSSEVCKFFQSLTQCCGNRGIKFQIQWTELSSEMGDSQLIKREVFQKTKPNTRSFLFMGLGAPKR